jgi:hypothetical protein
MSETLPLATEEGAILYLPQGATARAQYIDKLAQTDPTDDAKLTVVVGGVAYNTTWGALKAANLHAVPEIAQAAIAGDVQAVETARQDVEDNATSAAVSEGLALDAADMARDERLAAQIAKAISEAAAEQARIYAENMDAALTGGAKLVVRFSDLPTVGEDRQLYSVLEQGLNYRWYTARPSLGTPGYVFESRSLLRLAQDLDARINVSPGDTASSVGGIPAQFVLVNRLTGRGMPLVLVNGRQVQVGASGFEMIPTRAEVDAAAQQATLPVANAVEAERAARQALIGARAIDVTVGGVPAQFLYW